MRIRGQGCRHRHVPWCTICTACTLYYNMWAVVRLLLKEKAPPPCGILV